MIAEAVTLSHGNLQLPSFKDGNIGALISEDQHLIIASEAESEDRFIFEECTLSESGWGTNKAGESRPKITVHSLLPWVSFPPETLDTPTKCRALVRGFKLVLWPEKTHFTKAGMPGFTRDRLTMMGSGIPASSSVVLRDAKSDGYPGCAWVTSELDMSPTDFSRLVAYLSFFGQLLLGEQVDLMWVEIRQPDQRVKRLYAVTRPATERMGEPMAPTHSPSESARLPRLFGRFLEVADSLRLPEVSEQLVRSQQVSLNDQRRELSLALETLANAFRLSHPKSQSSQFPIPKNIYRKALPRLKRTVRLILKGQSTKGLKVIEKRLESSLNAPTNADQLLALAHAVGITPTKAETDAVDSRNRALHGANFIPLGADRKVVWKEISECRVLRTLLNRIILRLLKHDGYYTDYSTVGWPFRPI